MTKNQTDAKDAVWAGDWRAKIRSRLSAFDCETLTAFLARFPAEPYGAVAMKLGDDVAAFQVEWMQFEEGKDSNRRLAMDSLARDLRQHLADGWRQGTTGDFETAGSYADWIGRLGRQKAELRVQAQAVWDALEASKPPRGWKPSGPADPIIVAAFAAGWPER